MAEKPITPGALSDSTVSYEGVEILELMEAADNYNAALLEIVKKYASPAGSVIDFGAGIGTFARRLVTSGYHVRCVEQDSGQRARLRQHGLDAVATLNDIEPASADYIYTLNVLEHIADDRAILADLCDRLGSGGRLLIYVPAFPVLYSSFDRSVGHVRRYRMAPLIERAQEAGLTVMEAYYYDSLGFFAALVAKWTSGRRSALSRRSLVLYDRFVFPLSRLFDRWCGGFFGKNLVLVAYRPKK